MKVGFDVTPLVRPVPRGVIRATAGVVEALERRARLEVVRLAPPEGAPLRAWRAGALPAAVRDQGLAGLHSPFSAFPWRGPGRRVHTIHEVPWRHGVHENAGIRHRLWAALGPWRADATLCPSEVVASDLRRRLLPGAGKVKVVPWGVEARFAPEPPPGVIDEALLGRYRLGDEPFALCLGATRAKKNLAAVLHGLAALHAGTQPRLKLVVTGGDTPDLRRDLGLASRLGLARWVQTLDEVDEADLPGLLRLATAVPVLSRSEGFGFPALEALACGTPTLVSRGSAQAEVAGEAGFEVDPDEPESVAAGLARAIDEREALRHQLPARAAGFTWDATAEAIEQLWESLA